MNRKDLEIAPEMMRRGVRGKFVEAFVVRRRSPGEKDFSRAHAVGYWWTEEDAVKFADRFARENE